MHCNVIFCIFSGDTKKKVPDKASADASYTNPAFHADESGTGRSVTLSAAEQGGYTDGNKIPKENINSLIFQDILLCYVWKKVYQS